jgi:hypothetical protein
MMMVQSDGQFHNGRDSTTDEIFVNKNKWRLEVKAPLVNIKI